MAYGYAQDTQVPVERSRAEIERMLRNYGAKSFQSGWNETHGSAYVAFEIQKRQVQFTLPIPSADDKRFAKDGNKKTRTPEGRERAAEKEQRRRWRCLALLVKAKLEGVESGIVGFEEEFLGAFVVAGQTIAAHLVPRLDALESAFKALPAAPRSAEAP